MEKTYDSLLLADCYILAVLMAYFTIVLRMVFLSEVIRECYVAAEVSFRLRCTAFGIVHIFVDIKIKSKLNLTMKVLQARLKPKD
jgi:hypothetical protein